jgi:glycosyltransferase involved in cell wall biosynthesis
VRPPRVVLVELGSIGQGLTGGENCLVHVIGSLAERGFATLVLTTDAFRQKLERERPSTGSSVRWLTIPAGSASGGGRALASYLRRTAAGPRLARAADLGPDDVVVCNSELLPNIGAFRVLTRRAAPQCPVYWFRSPVSSWWRGWRGQFGRPEPPTGGLLVLRVAQRCYARSIRTGGRVLVQNRWARDVVSARCPDAEVRLVTGYPGRPDLSFNPDRVARDVDLVWMGRFHDGKGALDLVPMMRRLGEIRPGTTVLVIGGGDPEIRRRLEAECRRQGLGDAITLTGAIPGEARFRELARGRLFLLTSRFEGAPNVEIEAMACGLPVLRYDLPLYDGRTRGRRSVPAFDPRAMADEAARLLEDSAGLAALAREARDEVAGHDWATVADQVVAAATPRERR